MSKKNFGQYNSKPKFDKPQSRAVTPPRVAARLKPQAKNMRVRSKKNSLGGKK